MGVFGLHRAGVIELPTRMSPAGNLLDVPSGVDAIVAGEGIGVDVDCEVGQKIPWAIAPTAVG